MLNDFWLALGFLTTLPARTVAYQPDSLGRAAPWFPVVGLLIGALLAGVAWLAGLIFPPLLAAVIVVAAWAVFTGGLHLDGFADCCDGLLVSAPPARRLEIMRDPRMGAFGVSGLVLLLLIKAAAVDGLNSVLPALLAAPVWSRWLLLLAARQPAARPGGLGAALAGALTPRRLLLSLAAPLLVLAAAAWFTPRAWPAAALAVAAALGVIWLARRRIGGVTGDVFGAVVEVSELAVLLAFAAR